MKRECKYRMSLPEDQRECIEHSCHHYIPIRLRDAQTGNIIDEFMCDDLARLQTGFDLGKGMVELGAAIESLRNVVSREQSNIEYRNNGTKVIGH